MTTDDARRAEAPAHHLLAEADRFLLDIGRVPGGPPTARGPDPGRADTSGYRAHEHGPNAGPLDGPCPPGPDAADEPPDPARHEHLRATEADDQDEDAACSATCPRRLLADRYAAERDQARAELATVRRLVERHITTHGIYADRRLREWYDATAMPRPRRET